MGGRLVLHLEAECSQAFDFHSDPDGVPSLVDLLPRGAEVGHLLQGECSGALLGDFSGATPLPIPKFDFHVLGPQFQGANLHLYEPVEDEVTQAILQAQLHAIRVITQRTKTVEVLEDRGRDHVCRLGERSSKCREPGKSCKSIN